MARRLGSVNMDAAREAMLVEQACAKVARICYTGGRANEIAEIMAEAKRRGLRYGWTGSQSMASVITDLEAGLRFDEAEG